MATQKLPIRSILKQPSKDIATPENDNKTTTSQTSADAEEAAKKKRYFDIAIKHALLIDHQKKTQDDVVKNIELLIDFPRSSPPTAQDATQFLKLVEIFQPSNFDELVEERRIDGKCGYPLCAEQPRGLGLKESESWKLKKGAGDWCSTECTRKGLYVKAQLGEVPAWERVPGQQAPVILHEADRHLVPATDARDEAAKIKKVQQRVAERTELAMERGEQAASLRPNEVMTDFVVEKTPSIKKGRNLGTVKFASSTAIEGYEPRTATNEIGELPPVAEVAAIMSKGAEKAPAKVDDSDNTSADEDDEDQQWKDMFEQMKKRG